MKSIYVFYVLIFLTITDGYSQKFSLTLYPKDVIPNNRAYVAKIAGEQKADLSKVQIPDITVFLPAKAHNTGQAVIICPGGGYRHLSMDKEGMDIAKFWNSKGIAGIVLKYRLPDAETQLEPYNCPLMDAQRAMRLVRYHAEEWGIESNQIGIMGFSAGGHLASSLSTHYDTGNLQAEDPVEQMSCRPDYSILVYPVISFTADFQHEGSRKNLVGEDASLMKYYSSELQVTADTPTAIMVHSADDRTVPVKNSIVYFEALQQKGVEAEMHLYPHGGHGFGLAIEKGNLADWPELVWKWVKSRKQ